MTPDVPKILSKIESNPIVDERERDIFSKSHLNKTAKYNQSCFSIDNYLLKNQTMIFIAQNEERCVFYH